MATRRALLKYLAAAIPAAARVQTLERRGPALRVIVLGGGLAGLCTAYELRRQGHTATILEAQSRPGGRVRTFRENFAPGLYGEAGAEAIPASHDLTQHYARTLGLTLLPTAIPNTRSFYHVGGKRTIADDKAVWPFALTPDERQLGMTGLARKYIEAALAEAQAAGYAEQPVRAMAAWDGMKPGAWLQGKGASRGAAELLTLGFGMEFGSAASYLLHRLNSMGGRGSYRVEGGNDNLPRAFARHVEIRYGAPVVAVAQDERGVQVKFRRGSTVETLSGDRAVCALPCPVIGGILDDARLAAAKQRAIREQHYSLSAKVFLQARTRFWLRDGWSGFVTTDLPIERLTPDPGGDALARGALTAYPIAGYANTLEQMSKDERVAAAYAQARQIFPEFDAEFEGGVSKAWGADQWQRGAFALHTPGQIGFLTVLAQAEGRVHFAGEHTSHWTGWMQGALDSARRVVQEING